MNLNKLYPEKRIFVTGGASGLGYALIQEFIQLGWNKIAILDFNRSRLKEVEVSLKSNGIDCICHAGDISKSADWKKIKSEIIKRWNGLDILVNNAGIGSAGSMDLIPEEQWDKIIQVNLKGPILGTIAFVPVFKKQNSGHIINIASSAGIASLANMAPYNIVKAGLISLSETQKIELAFHNIGVTCVAPTFFDSNMSENSFSVENHRKMGDAMRKKKSISASVISQDIIKAISKKKFYVITQADGRFIWRFKRFFPEFYLNFMSYVTKTGLFEKYVHGKG